MRHAADALSGGLTPAAGAEIRAAHQIVVERLLPHEHAEERELYPAVALLVGGRDGVAPMSRSHTEIERLVVRLARHLAGSAPLAPDQVDDLRATSHSPGATGEGRGENYAAPTLA